MRSLQVPYDRETEIEEKLAKVEGQSEELVRQVLDLVEQIKSAKEEKGEAATGLIQADVVRWKENRMCSINSYICSLRRELGRAIGYDVPLSLPF